MMPVTFEELVVGKEYSRSHLAKLWGYSGIQGLSRGVVTPRGSNNIILFVTHEKQSDAEQYADELQDGVLHWEGPTDHFAEDRLMESSHSGDLIHLFYRRRHHRDFTYFGRLELLSCERHGDRPSQFRFGLSRREPTATSRPD
jgi:hypothetical protein